MRVENREKIARRAYKELKPGMFVNLGAGIPTEIPWYLPDDFQNGDVCFMFEAGTMGAGKYDNNENVDVVFRDASFSKPVSEFKGGAYFDCSISFGIMRGPHLDYTVLGALEVDQEGSLANWIIPGKYLIGMGGAMDLVEGAQHVLVLTEHMTRMGTPKILKKCKLPLTGYRKATTIITELAVFDVLPDGKGLMLREIDPSITVEELRKITDADFEVSDALAPYQQ